MKIKNTSAVPLRAAYLHGPYTVYVACYPSTYDPSINHTRAAAIEGTPDFEPQLKAGGHWHSKLVVPDEIRKDADQSFFDGTKRTDPKSFTWIIEVASQVLFSTTAAVHFEVLVGRDAKSIELGFHGVVGSAQGIPGRLEDHQQGRARNAAQAKGVFSKAVRLAVDDTESLWNTPAFPTKDEQGQNVIGKPPQHGDKRDAGAKPASKSKRQKKIHLVLLSHGLHSNLGADMLYMKESIDTAARQAKENARRRKAEKAAAASGGGRARPDDRAASVPEIIIAPTTKLEDEESNESDSDDEETLVRGFNGNAVKTEKGIQYLGKRFAKYVLLLTYPNQPYLPVKTSISKSITRSLTGSKLNSMEKKNNAQPDGGPDAREPAHKNSTIIKDEKHTGHKDDLPYKITSISFIGHSLGGLVQTYAIAYIQKHSPEFFDLIRPVNFVALATPFLGLSNENPMYVKFALDFGLVGRTGQDLGLAFRSAAFAKYSWSTMMSGLGVDNKKDKDTPDPAAKPLLRILPTGPAHVALKKFRHRTVYANVVNDGIVPLRTSCLLFLDWRGLGRVEKARRENGLVGTMLEWGWTEMLGQNVSSPRKALVSDVFTDDDNDSTTAEDLQVPPTSDPKSNVPQADASQDFDDAGGSDPSRRQFLDSKALHDDVRRGQGDETKQNGVEQASNMWTGLLSFFRPQAGTQKSTPKKSQRMYHRGQTMLQSNSETDEPGSANESSNENPRKSLVRGPSLYSTKSGDDGLQAPPKTTVFESAGDLLHPPLPPREFILDPAARPRTIFHDRVYHPDDIPAPPIKKQRTFLKKSSSRDSDLSNSGNDSMQIARPVSQQSDSSEVGSMKIEEKIARAYHKDLTWRKVLVCLEPDAHNNMIVRRMFANAYGWPVIQHLCDTHFGYTAAAYTRDEDVESEERAKAPEAKVDADGEKVHGQLDPPKNDETSTRPWSTSKAQPQKSATMNNMEDLPQSPTDIDKIHSKLSPPSSPQVPTAMEQQSPPGTAKPTSSPNRTKRTESEAREARDEVHDLVSRITASGTLSAESSGSSSTTFSNLNSSRSAIRNLTRQDSGRWSDHFFEDDEEDEDEEVDNGYREELRRAKERGEVSGLKHVISQEVTDEPGQMSEGEENILEKKISGHDRGKAVTKPAESVDPQILGLTGMAVGLGKSVEEHVGAPKSPETQTSSTGGHTGDEEGVKGIGEHVARQSGT